MFIRAAPPSSSSQHKQPLCGHTETLCGSIPSEDQSTSCPMFIKGVPLSGYFPSLNELNFGQGNFTAGKEFTLFQFDNVSFSNLICYESSLPDIVRKYVLNGSEFINLVDPTSN